MTAIEIFSILFSGSLLAGLIGALSGLGGGLIIVPLLVFGIHADIHYAIGTSLIAVIATSSGAASAYVREGFSNVRVGLLLETGTTFGAILGVIIGSHLPGSALHLAFGLVLLYSAIASLYGNGLPAFDLPPDKLATFFKLDGQYPIAKGYKAYHVQNVPLGYFIILIAGLLSGALGIGSGALKVLALDKAMKLPFKVSTTTSNFMIGVTAAASAGLYLHLGYIDPILTLPVLIGVTLGSLCGARILPRMKTDLLRKLFILLIVIIAIQMIYTGIF